MFVIKVGGSTGIDYDAVCDDIARLVQSGQKLILVHGGSSLTNEVAEQLGHPPRFITSPSGYTSRFTDRRTLEIFEMVYCGQMNKGIVERLQQRGINAVGLSGLDGRLWEGKRKKAIRAVDENGRKFVVRNNYTGTVETVNTALLESLLAAGYLPVLTPPAISEEGEAINVDGDRAARATAVALKAETLVILSNIPGLLRDFPKESSLIPEIPKAQIEEFQAFAAGRMRIKLLGAKEALDQGVSRVVLGDARVENPVSQALSGQGTVIQ
ncbi:MAG: [LysW]-aminoadipate kinase [Ardenticatenaceae bacterium]|nr:[LysW]-aminoadipate kinase [Ardenticatenaceae bacterium]